jgi:L-threonylcarbamoyladenylate synthase
MQSGKIASRKEIASAALRIQQGELVAFPTETVYGLGAHALDENAVLSIFEMKERPVFDPLIVHIGTKEELFLYARDLDPWISDLADRFWPGPLTMVLPKQDLIPDLVTSGLPTVGIRMPKHPVALELLRTAQCPIAAPSANKFGKVSPTQADHVRKGLPFLDCILEGGNSEVGIESTIIGFRKEGFYIYRHGAITRQMLEKVVPYAGEKPIGQVIQAPGMMDSHYSPDKPLYILGETLPGHMDLSKGVLFDFSGQYTEGFGKVEPMGKRGDLASYALHLFRVLQAYQDSQFEFMVAEPVPEQGLGLAIMDRLRKAAFRYK